MPPQAVQPAAAPAFVPCLWFEKEAEDALRFYASVFEGARIGAEMRAGDGGPLPKGTLVSAKLTLRGSELVVVNGGPKRAFNDSMSLVVYCGDQAEIDRYWDALVAGGQPTMCGWLKDKFGVSWQIVPRNLGELLGDPDPVAARRVMQAMLTMKKLDLPALERARAGR